MSENENENQTSSCPRACYRANFSYADNIKVEPLPYVGINTFQVIPKTPTIHITINGDAAVQASSTSTPSTAKDFFGGGPPYPIPAVVVVFVVLLVRAIDNGGSSSRRGPPIDDGRE
jgi:hypothetical protein